MGFQNMYLDFMGGLMLILPLLGIACGLVMGFQPRHRNAATRLMMIVSGAMMALSGVTTIILTRPGETPWHDVFFAALGIMLVAQGISWGDRRVRGAIGGIGIVAVGIWFASAWLRPDDFMFAWRYALFGFGEFFVISGAVMAVGAWQGWLLPPEADDNSLPHNPMGIIRA